MIEENLDFKNEIILNRNLDFCLKAEKDVFKEDLFYENI